MTATRILSATAVLALATASMLSLAPWRGEPRYTFERLGAVSVLSLNDSGWMPQLKASIPPFTENPSMKFSQIFVSDAPALF